ncbi:MAG: PilN domain-containing protein [Gammaproteobacteria bacterium]
MFSDSRLNIDWLRDRARTFFDWWSSELWMLLPESMRQLANLEPDRWVVHWLDTEIEVVREDGGRDPAAPRFSATAPPEAALAALRHLGSDRTPATEVILELPPRRALRREIDLPLAAEENLREVLGYAMDQETPFKAGQVYYDYRILDRHTAMKRLRVELVAIPRTALDEILGKLTPFGLHPDRVRAPEAGGNGNDINLLPLDRRRVKTPVWQGLNLALAAVATGLLAAAVFLPLIQKQWSIDVIEGRIAEVKAKAQAVEDLHRQLEGLASDSRFLIEKKKATPVTIGVLDELTRVLPDDTWLYQLEINGTEMTMQGESPTSSAVIGLIEASPLFKNASFRSPVTQNRLTGAERFNLAAEVVAEAGS